MNLTDVDDKTIAGANVGAPLVGARTGQAQGLPLQRLNAFTAPYIQAFNEDLKMLNCLLPTHQPRATLKIQSMLKLIEKLEEKGIAYASGGSVYYRVSRFPAYGKLSKKKLEMNIAGASERVDADEYEKEQVTDFVLWKKSKDGEPSWPSKWGPGRPGWHIECSAMSMEELGEQFDIHAGGEDLIFPHHENEIAQSEGATGKAPFVKYWLHCKFLLVDGKKMSKRDGNFYTLRDLIAKGYDPMAIRYALLSSHYQTPLNFTLNGLQEAGEVIKKLDDCYALIHPDFDGSASVPSECGTVVRLEALQKEIIEGLSSDLNVSTALASMLEGVKWINRAYVEGEFNDAENCKAALAFFSANDKIFGLDIAESAEVPGNVFSKMRERSEIRRQIKEQGDKSLWKESDRLRDEIQALGWRVKDRKPGELSILKKKRRTWD